MSRDPFLQAAIEEARKSLAEGGIPIGSMLVHEGPGEATTPRADRQPHRPWRDELPAQRRTPPGQRLPDPTIYSTLSPCPMCAIVLYTIPRVVAGENRAFPGAEEYMRANGIQVDVVEDAECIELMAEFIRANPRLWNEDIGV
jgi:cytosine deaminase